MGIGYELVKAMVHTGATVIAAARNVPALTHLGVEIASLRSFLEK